MIYQKNEYLLLVPWVRKEFFKKIEEETPAVKDKDKESGECKDKANDDGSFNTLLFEHTYVLFDRDAC